MDGPGASAAENCPVDGLVCRTSSGSAAVPTLLLSDPVGAECAVRAATSAPPGGAECAVRAATSAPLDPDVTFARPCLSSL